MIELPWADFKAIIDSGASFRYFDISSVYIVFIVDNAIVFRADIPKDGGADQIDFDNNYKANANTFLRAPISWAAISAVTNVGSSATSVTLLSANVLRKSAMFFNNSAQNCYLKFGTTASSASFTVKMEPGSTLIMDVTPIYTGRIDAIWDSADGSMAITELT